MTEEELSRDFDDLVSEFVNSDVEFLVVGAHALAAHGHPRATDDLDLLVLPSPENAQKVYQALAAFGAPVQAHGVQVADFTKEGTVYQLGLPPRRIDILTSLSGVTFSECSEGAPVGRLGSQRVRFISRGAQIKNKRATGRTRDLADAEILEALAEER